MALTGWAFFGIAKASGKEAPLLLMGGSFERPPVFRFVPGARRTLLYPATEGSHGEITAMKPRAFMGSASWDGLLANAREHASLLTATLEPSMIRDKHGVIQMAVICNEDPMTASCVLSPGFLRRFSAVFGPELIVIIPTRNKIYVFPKLANRLLDMAQTVRDDYLISPAPVSTEIFELSAKGLRAIGDCDQKD